MEVEEGLHRRTQGGVLLLESSKLLLRGSRHCLCSIHTCMWDRLPAVMSLPTGCVAELALPASRYLHHRATTELAPGFCFSVDHRILTFKQSLHELSRFYHNTPCHDCLTVGACSASCTTSGCVSAISPQFLSSGRTRSVQMVLNGMLTHIPIPWSSKSAAKVTAKSFILCPRECATLFSVGVY
jgi:hypothetical protein